MNYLHNLYIFIFNKTKKYLSEIKQLKETNEDDLVTTYYINDPEDFKQFWESYLKIYNPPPPSLTYHKLIYTQSLIYFIIVIILIIFIFIYINMKLEIFLLLCLGVFIYDIYYDHYFLNMYKKYKKYGIILVYTFIAFSFYLVFKKILQILIHLCNLLKI